MNDVRTALDMQLNMAWQLFEYHMTNLSDEEWLWRPAARGLHVSDDNGVLRADWPESESYDIGPASIAWLTGHIVYWWSMALDHAFGNAELQRNDVTLPGSVDEVKRRIGDLKEQWVSKLAALEDAELAATKLTKWPFTDKPFYTVAAWLNMELMKNASEIGYCRFLYATR